jgi:hypothetical protein
MWDPLDAVLDLIAAGSMAFAVYYILKLRKLNANPIMMLFSPLVFYKYLILLVSLVIIFVGIDITADHLFNDQLLIIYGFEFGLASGSFGIMLITRRVHEQVAHAGRERVKKQLRKDLDEVMHRRMRFKEENFKEENR